jgi:hypothetical protein
VASLVQSRIFFCRGNGNRIEVNRGHFFGAESFRRQRENASAGSEIDQ